MKLRHFKGVESSHLLILLLVSLIPFNLKGGMLYEFYEIREILLAADDRPFEKALEDLGIPSGNYVRPEQVEAEPGKNIIVISLESLEQGFLREPFTELTPNLSALSKTWSFVDDFQSLPGCDWTAASIYAHQVGIPAFFKGQGNDFFQGTEELRLTGLGHILKAAGYQSRFLIGNPDFAGISDLLKAYHIPVVSEKNCLGQYDKAPHGLHDLDLFREAKLRVKKLSKDSSPFALFIQTANSHFPNGIHDARMENFLAPRDRGLEFSIAALDYLLGDFIEYLESEDLLDDTGVFIFPDHELMGRGQLVKELEKSERKLYLISNVEKSSLGERAIGTMHPIDLPRTILNGSQISSNAKFLPDFISSPSLFDFIESKRSEIVSLNCASVRRLNYRSSLTLSIEQGDLFLRSENSQLRVPLGDGAFSASFDFTFDREMNFISVKSRKSIQKALSRDSLDLSFQRLHLLVSLKSGKLQSAYLGDKRAIGLAKSGERPNFSKSEIASIIASNEQVLGSQPPERKLIVDSKSSTLADEACSEIRLGRDRLFLSSGLSLLTLEKAGLDCHLYHFDLGCSKANTRFFIETFPDLTKDSVLWILVSYDSLGKHICSFSKELSALGLPLLADLDENWAYMAWSRKGEEIKEEISKDSLTYAFPLDWSITLPQEKRNLTIVSEKEYSQDKRRFIAHAGGAVNGKTYTNSLEALNSSYEKGFRFFELDILRSADQCFLAAHDWPSWKEGSDYEGSLPPKEDEFLQHKILGEYTPLSMEGINRWFARHEDCVLITDKVNTPLAFAEKFVDKSRLSMEVFSWTAVEQGLRAGIRSVIPTGKLLYQIKGDPLEYLKRLGIEEVSFSRRILTHDRALVEKLVLGGIKIFAFQVQLETGLHGHRGRGESFVVENERRFFFGLYADDWKF